MQHSSQIPAELQILMQNGILQDVTAHGDINAVLQLCGEGACINCYADGTFTTFKPDCWEGAGYRNVAHLLCWILLDLAVAD